MGIFGNFSRQNLGAIRLVGGGAVALSLGNTRNYQSGLWINNLLNSGATTVLAQKTLPTGYVPPGAWRKPIVGGEMSMQWTGAGDLVADLYPSLSMEIDFTGAGDFDASASLVVSMLLALTGSGTLTADIVGALSMSVDFEGSGDLDASMVALGNMAMALTGSGDLDATTAAYADMSIDIVVTGSGLTTANVGQAVWDYVLSCGYSAEAAMQILTAVAAGKSTIVDNGGGSADVVFRDLLDTRDVVDAEMQDSERITVTYDP